MKKLKVVDQEACMACKQCEVVCSETFYKTYDPDLSCIQIGTKKDAVKTFVCVQCGKCAKACEHDAITQNAKGVYMINKKNCVGCGKCVEACPFNVMPMPEGAANPTKCIACGKCAKACPVDAIAIVE